MRIVMIANQAPPAYGGAGTQALALSVRLVARGHTVDLLTRNQLGSSRRELVDGVRVLRCPLESMKHVMGHGRAAEVVGSAAYMIWLTIRLVTSRYDVMHVHGAYWWTLPAATLARLRGTPLVVKVTGLDFDDAQTVAGKKLGPLSIGWLYGLSFRWASVVIVLNDEIADRHLRFFPRTPIARIPNGVDTDRFTPRDGRETVADLRHGLPPHTKVVLFTGYLAPVKGLRSLLEAWRTVLIESKEQPLLVLVGPDRGFYRELDHDLLALLKAGGGEHGRVRLTGHLEPDKMPDTYRAADVFVLPSLSEGMPNSVLEALASGLPVVATDIPGTRDAVAGSSAATLVPVEKPALLARALLSALSDDPDRRTAARRLAVDRFSLDVVARSYEVLYQQLVPGTVD